MNEKIAKHSREREVEEDMITQLEDAGYNDGAIRWILGEIKKGGKGNTVEGFRTLAVNLRQLKKINDEHGD